MKELLSQGASFTRDFVEKAGAKPRISERKVFSV
jgi:hypothetical protein